MCAARAGTLVAGRYWLRARIAAAGDREDAWRADDLARGCPVAVRLPKAGRPVPADDFLATVGGAARVCHPGIVRILDYGQAGTEGIPFLVTELVETASVAVVLRAGRLDPAWVLDVICQVSSALEAVHAVGLIHRDIQPGNLLLAPEAWSRCRVMDVRRTRPVPRLRRVPGTRTGRRGARDARR